ncbi:MAG: hypothetical protein ACRC1V_01550 [Plesiomonas sp.]
MSDNAPAPAAEPEAPTVKTYTEDEVNALVGGLKTKVDELLSEKKTVAQKAKEAEQARIAAEQEAAKKAGELDKFEQSLRSGFEKEKGELSATLDALKSRVVGESKKAMLGQFMGSFVAPESVDVIAQLVKTEFDGTEVKTQFTDFAGNVITTDAAEFKKWMAKHPAISHLMKAEVMQGGGATGSKGGASGAGTLNRKQFENLDHTARKQFFADGGKLTD